MRLTCLKCGHQFEIATGPTGPTIGCICGTEFEPPGVLNTGVLPDSLAAERSRQKAFRAAGLVRNVGGFALGISALGLLFFPLALVGAGVGIYCLTMLRGPVGRYSGRRWAIWSIVVGVLIFVLEGALALDYMQTRREQELLLIQASAADDLKRLRRSQVLFRATHPAYGDFTDFRFKPATGRYTIYLEPTIYHAGRVDGQEMIAPLPDGLVPAVGLDDFTAVAVANLDSDDDLDVWVMTSEGSPRHVENDLDGLGRPEGFFPGEVAREGEVAEGDAEHEEHQGRNGPAANEPAVTDQKQSPPEPRPKIPGTRPKLQQIPSSPPDPAPGSGIP